jgi:hypothetical protein
MDRPSLSPTGHSRLRLERQPRNRSRLEREDGRPPGSEGERLKSRLPYRATEPAMKRRSNPGIPKTPREPRHRGPPLGLNASLEFTVGQSVLLGDRTMESARSMVRDVLRGRGFRVNSLPAGLLSRSGGSSPTETRLVQVAERNVRRGPTNPPTLHAILALVGAGLVLGILDTILAGAVIYVTPWIAAAAAVSLALWLRYGRTFESDVIIAAVRDTSGTSGGTPGAKGQVVSPEVFLEAGRVLSVVHGGKRTAVQTLDCPPPHIRELVNVVHTFETLAKNPSAGSVAAPSRLPG